MARQPDSLPPGYESELTGVRRGLKAAQPHSVPPGSARSGHRAFKTQSHQVEVLIKSKSVSY